MSNKNSNRITVGVSLEHHVLTYLDELAQRMGMSRSWVLNTVVYEYAKLIENKDLVPLVGRFHAHRSKDVVINA